MAGTGDIDYEVYRILDKRVTENSQVEYLIRWKGFTSDWDTWEPADSLGNCQTKIYGYERKLKAAENASKNRYVRKLVNKSKMAKKETLKVLGGKVKKVSVKNTSSTVKVTNKLPQSKATKSSTENNGKKSVTEIMVYPSGKTVTKIQTNSDSSPPKAKLTLQAPKKKADVLSPSKGASNSASVLKSTPKSAVKKVKTSGTEKTNQNDSESASGSGAKQTGNKTPKAKSKLDKENKGSTPVSKKKEDNVKEASKSGSKKKVSTENVVNSKGVKRKSKSESGTSASMLSKKSKTDGMKKADRSKSETAEKFSDAENLKFSAAAKKIKLAKKSAAEKELKNKKLKLANGKTILLKNLSKSQLKNLQLGKKIRIKKEASTPKVNESASKNSPPSKKKSTLMKVSVSGLVGLTKNKSLSDVGKSKAKKRKLYSPSGKTQEGSNLDDDDDVLYSLSDFESSPSGMSGFDGRSKSESHINGENQVKKKPRKPKLASETSNVKGPRKGKEKKIRLLDSLKQPLANKPVRPVSPTPLYTTVKYNSTAATATVIPTSSRPQWVLSEAENMIQAGDQQASLPISPASMSYKVLLENLPHQLHPKKNKKGEETDEDVERRVSVRASECAFKYKEIVIKKCQKYTQIWLNTHTTMKNALNPTVMHEICAALNAAKYDDSNLVMFSGLGNVFCSGIDLHYLLTGDRKVAARKMVDALRDLIRKFIMFPKLIVAVVTGPAIGLGSSLLPLCDIVYASDKATFYMPYAQLSQTPEGCATYTLCNCLGVAMANELLVGGRKLTAIEACQLGLVSQVYWPTSMMQEVIPRVQHMALLSGKVMETTKLLVRSHQRTKLDLTNESECNLLVERWPSSECQKAIEDFLCNEKNYTL